MRTLADYTANDVAPLHLTPEDQALYAQHVERWQTELHPNGALECYFAAEIVRATWRIERYAIFSPAEMPQNSHPLDAEAKMLRYRAQTNLGIRRNLDELRRLQSERYLQAHLGILLPGLASISAVGLKLVLAGLNREKSQSEAPQPAPKRRGKLDPAVVAANEANLHAQIQEEEQRQFAEFNKNNPSPDPEPESPATPRPGQPASTTPKPEAPRNAPCPCGSGQKYKRCCGHWSQTPLPKAA